VAIREDAAGKARRLNEATALSKCGRDGQIRRLVARPWPTHAKMIPVIRPATIHDVPRVQEIINSHAEVGKMLFKSLAQLYEHLRDFGVYEDAGQVVGCVALTIIWADLAEVRSLAVDRHQIGRGIGRRLVEWSVAEGHRLGIRKLMALTYEQAFFEKAGFVVVEKETLPLKVWTDCVRCPKREGCDEIAMVRTLTDVPDPHVQPAPPTPRGLSIPVLNRGEE
jgi:amino-acid N-acetyltransferase